MPWLDIFKLTSYFAKHWQNLILTQFQYNQGYLHVWSLSFLTINKSKWTQPRKFENVTWCWACLLARSFQLQSTGFIMRSFFLWVNYWPDDSSLSLLTMSMKIPFIWCDSEIRKKKLLSNHLLKRENKIFNIFSRLLYESCCFVVYFLLTMIEDSGF